MPDGRDRVVRHGHGPQRAIQTGVGPVEVRRAKVRDRGDVGAEEKIRFTSSILPKWARRTKSLDALLPILYLRGVSTGDFQEALAALLGKDAPNLSPAVVTRLTAEWQADYDGWQKREPLGAALRVRVRVGGRRLPAGANGRQRRMHAGADRRHPHFGIAGVSRFSLRCDGVDFLGRKLILARLALQPALQTGEVEINHRGRIERQDLAESQSAHHGIA